MQKHACNLSSAKPLLVAAAAAVVAAPSAGHPKFQKFKPDPKHAPDLPLGLRFGLSRADVAPGGFLLLPLLLVPAAAVVVMRPANRTKISKC